MGLSTIYIFLDEGGNFDFSPKGTRYFSLSAASLRRPFKLHTSFDTYKYDLIEGGYDVEFFHCSHDNRHIRKRVFGIIAENLPQIRIDALVVEKPKTNPSLYDVKTFYPKMLGYLLPWVISSYRVDEIAEVVVITDRIPIKRKRDAVEKAVKVTLASRLPVGVPYRVMHHESRSHYGLQLADYCNWAIFRKWERGESEHYDCIKRSIKSEFDIFRSGITKFYEKE